MENSSRSRTARRSTRKSNSHSSATSSPKAPTRLQPSVSAAASSLAGPGHTSLHLDAPLPLADSLPTRRSSRRSASSIGQVSKPQEFAEGSSTASSARGSSTSPSKAGKASEGNSRPLSHFPADVAQLSNTGTQRRTSARASRSSTSEKTSPSISQREYSPFSAPSTPATAHSIATNVSAPSSSRGGSSRTSAESNKGKSPLATSSARVNLKRKEPSPVSSEVSSKRSKSDRRYPLRSQAYMAPPRKSSGSSAANTKSRSMYHAEKGRPARDADAYTEASSLSQSDGMEVDVRRESNSIDIDSAPPGAPAHDDEAGSDSHMEQNDEGIDAMQDAERAEDDDLDGNEHVDDDHMIDDEDEENEDEEDEVHYEDEEEDEEDEDDEEDPYGDGGENGRSFGSHLRAMAGYMSGLAGKFRVLLNSLRNRRDPTTQLVALQELSEILSISNEDTLAGYFPTETFVAELIYLMGGPKPARTITTSSSSAKSAEELEQDLDEEEALAAAAALDDNGEMMLLACRCLANLIEAMPYAAHSVVSHGAVPVLNAKLVEIEFIDLAEQVLQTMEKISSEYPSAIVREGGLAAMLQYLDFFNIHVQRTAMNAAANCCRRLTPEQFDKAKEVMPIIQNVLSYSDQRLVESACRCVVRLADSFRHHMNLLEQILTHDVVAAINGILMPGSTSSSSNTTVSVSIYTDVLKALGTAARASPTVAVTLLEANIVETLYLLLTGSPIPPAAGVDAQNEEGNAGAAVAVVQQDGTESVAMADVAILQNLAQRPKEQIQEALSLVAELLPPLPRDGIFDVRMYTEKAYNKRKSRAAKLDRQRQSKRVSGHHLPEEAGPVSGSQSAKATQVEKSHSDPVKLEKELAKETAQARRIATLQEKRDLVARFTKLILPTLVEVYSASVGWSVRSKALYGILKLVSFVDAEPLLAALETVPLASFIASILSGRDHPMLVQAALQLVELLTAKLPDVYSALFRREGVLWEIDDIASQKPSQRKEKSKTSGTDEQNSVVIEAPTALEFLSSEGSASSGGPSLTTVTSTLPSSNLSRLLAAAGSSSSGPASASAAKATTTTMANVRADSSLMSATVSGHVMSSVDADDSNIWRARVLCDLLSPNASEASAGGADEAGRALDDIKALVEALNGEKGFETEEVTQGVLRRIADLFCKPENPISSFELIRSGLVDGLYRFAIGDSDELPQETRRSMLTQAFMRDTHGTGEAQTSAASALVKRLQETLSRLENVDITTTIYSNEDNRRGPTANVARQVRLKLIAEDTADGEIPRSCTNIVVSIHAITSFQSLHDYLRPKIAASLTLMGSSSAPGASSGLSSMLESLASNAGLEMSSSLRETLRAAASGSGGIVLAGKAATGSEKKEQTGTEEADKKQPGESSSSGKTLSRRSSRLSAKNDKEAQDASSSSSKALSESKSGEHTSKSDALPDEAGDASDKGKDRDLLLAQRLVEGLLQDGMEGLEGEDAFSEDFDDEFFDEDGMSGLDAAAALASGATGGEETIQLDVAAEGDAKPESDEGPGRGEGSTSQNTSTSPVKPIDTRSGKASYASALQKRPEDWHLEFEMDGEKVDLSSTIYSAIHRQEMRNRSESNGGAPPLSRQVWSTSYVVKYRKVAGPTPKSRTEDRSTPEPPSQTSLPDSVDANGPFAQILLLLRVVYNLNREWRESQGWDPKIDASVSPALSETTFVNNKLTAKLNRQLEEPMIVASSCMPSWSMDLPRVFAFLFPFETRYAFLQSTSFGYHRLINRWQTQRSRNQEGSSSSSNRHDDSLALLGRLTRQKVRISRSNILASAFKVFELYGTSSSLLEVEYFDEVGTGLGPTLEFYALVSKEFAKKSSKMWRSDESRAGESEYVYAPHGLFPAPIDHSELSTAEGQACVHSFKILGQFVAKALFDSRIIDLNLSSTFMRAVLNQPIHNTLGMLRSVDSSLALSLEKLRGMPADEFEGLMLDFTLPGHEAYELHPGGKDEPVTLANVEQYIDEVITHTLVTGVQPLVRAFREGFDLIFPISSMSTFTPEELVMLFGNQEEDWDESTLLSSIKPDHGYNVDSSTFRDVIAVMTEFSKTERRAFLQWLTGSPKLPVGGFMGLHPQLTIVKRPPDANQTADQTLPSVMTCVNFCKMPPFSSREVMRQRLLLAMHEGQASFHLS